MKQTQTINIKIKADMPVEKIEMLDQMLDKFENDIQVLGGTCDLSKDAGMNIESAGFNYEAIEEISKHMGAQGVPPQQIRKMQLMVEAHMGRRSWESVFEEQSKTLENLEGYDRFNVLMELVELALNAGYHDKARRYFVEVEGMVESVKANPTILPSVNSVLLNSEIEKKRNWLYPKSQP